MDYFVDELAYCLALQGASPDAIYGTMKDRIYEYGQYKKWIPEEGKGEAGTLLWEVGKHIFELMGGSRNPFLLYSFGTCFLEHLKRAFVYELLTGRKDLD